MENADWKLDIIDLDATLLLLAGDSTTNGFRDVWSPDTDVTGNKLTLTSTNFP